MTSHPVLPKRPTEEAHMTSMASREVSHVSGRATGSDT